MPGEGMLHCAGRMNEIDRLERLHKLLLSLNAISAAAEDSYGLLDLVVTETMRLTDAEGAAVEWVEGEDLVYVKAGGLVAKLVGLRARRIPFRPVRTGAVDPTLRRRRDRRSR
jgi:hypothetical protein